MPDRPYFHFQYLEEKFSIPWLLKGLVFFLVALIFVGWTYYSPPGLLGKADAIGYAVCHRIDARTFHLGDRQLPLCARCSGMFLGALIGLVYQTATRPRRAGMPHWSVMIVLFILKHWIITIIMTVPQKNRVTNIWN